MKATREQIKERRLKFRERYINDPKKFGEEQIRNKDGELLKLCPHHLEWIRNFYENKRTLVKAFRGAGKTLICSGVMCLWITSFSRDKHFLIVSQTMDESRRILRDIKRQIIQNKNLQYLKPKFGKGVWSKNEISTSTGGSILCRPYNELVVGTHVDYILGNEVSRFTDHDIWFDSIEPIAETYNGKIMCITTPFSEFDLSARLESEEIYKTIELPLLDKKDFSLLKNSKTKKDFMKCKIKIVDPYRFPQEKIWSIYNDNKAFFPKNYMLEILSDAEKTFDEVKILYPSCSKKYSLIDMPIKGETYYAGIDPAYSETGDWFVIIIIGLNAEKNECYIRHIFRDRLPEHAQRLNASLRILNIFRPAKTTIDSSYAADTLAGDLADKGFNIEGIKFTGTTSLNEGNRSMLIENLRKYLRSDDSREDKPRLIIPQANENNTIELTKQLIHELRNTYRGSTKTGYMTYKTKTKYDDLLMGTCCSCHSANSGIISYNEITEPYIVERTPANPSNLSPIFGNNPVPSYNDMFR